ncbi:MAG: hypothetical protein EAY72_07815 [Bacteroidetes bacterium]|nr:MAG: hypothetical protein EAY72_07815 [Bacteroidota bacterium]
MKRGMRQFLLFIAMGFLTVNPVISQSCPCIHTFTNLQTAVEDNYAGFADKVTPKTKSIYDKLVTDLRKKASEVNTDKACYTLLKNYVAFYKDGHLQLSDLPQNSEANIQYQTLPENIETLVSKPQQTPSVQGIYKTDNYTLAVVPYTKRKNVYAAVTVQSSNTNWKKGMIKMLLTPQKNGYYSVEYFAADFQKYSTTGYLSGNVLEIAEFGIFEKIQPKQTNATPVDQYVSVFPSADNSITFIDSSAALLTLNNFSFGYQAALDSLLLFHKAGLEQRKNWIIDVRNNGGGSTSTYQCLLPYLFTNPIQQYGSLYRLSSGHVANFQNLLINASSLPNNVQQAVEEFVKNGTERPNQWFEKKGKIVQFDSVKNHPKKIAILTSKTTASSAEIFLMDAKQSKKVTIVGSYSAGVVDYGDGTNFSLGCSQLSILIPTRKSEYLSFQSFDNMGIRPDVLCDSKDALQVALQKLK